jgi:chromate reductase
MRILAIAGSLREGSHNRALLAHAAAIAPGHVEIAFYEGLGDLPHYDPALDGDDPPAPVRHLREELAGADAVLVSTPEYNGSVPGVLKNAIDWASRPFPDNAIRGKTVAVVGATTGRYGAIWAQQDARKSLGIAGARVLDEQLALGQANEAFDEDGSLVSEKHAQDLLAVVEALVRDHEAAPV